MPALTVHRVLVGHRMPRLAWLDRPTGQPVRRYERARSEELVHIDVKKLGSIPAGGGWWALGRAQRPSRHRSRPGYDYVHCGPLRSTAVHCGPLRSTAVHCAVDDHTRLAYAEIHRDEQATPAPDSCAGFRRRVSAPGFGAGFRRRVSAPRRRLVRRARHRTDRTRHDRQRDVLTSWSYRRSHAWREALLDIGASPQFTAPYRPQTNGKAERFNRTLAEEWAYREVFDSSAARTAALPEFLPTYNHHRAHTALDRKAPISRLPVNNLTGHYN